MKTKLILTTTLLTILSACSNQYNCRIEGKVEGANDGDTLIIARFTEENLLPTDTIILNHGQFSIKEEADSVTIASYFYLNREKEISYSNLFFIEPGNIFLEIGEEPHTSGTLNNELYQDLIDSISQIYQQENSIYASLDNLVSDADSAAIYDQAQQDLNKLSEQSNNILRTFIFDNINQPAGAFVFLNCTNLFEPQEVINLCDNIYPNYRNAQIIQKLIEDANNVLRTADGQQLSLPSMPNVKGDSLDLTDIFKKNKLTLIDCWASWCQPCREEMPNIKQLYKKYHRKGLEIVGISFDDDKTVWEKAIKEMELNWKHVSELKAWDNIMTLQYGITYIPFTILVDSNGTIIASRLTGEELAAAIAEQLD